MAHVTVVRDEEAMSVAAAERITSLIEAATVARGTAVVSLAGGRSPQRLYELLADPGHPWRARIDWTRVHVYWGDERHVPPDHPDSNFGMANRALIKHLPIPPTHIHRMRGEIPAVDAGLEYDALLRRRGLRRRGQTPVMGRLNPLSRVVAGSDPIHCFDVMLLGIGANAHIASIFPESPLLMAGREGPPYAVGRPFTGRHDELASGIWVPKLNQWRITMTPPALLDSENILVIAAGTEKADAIAAAINAPEDVARYPAQLLRTAGDRVEWIIDQDAASRL